MILFKNIKFKCDSIEGVVAILRQISQNAQDDALQELKDDLYQLQSKVEVKPNPINSAKILPQTGKDYFIHRLIKVGKKSFIPRVLNPAHRDVKHSEHGKTINPQKATLLAQEPRASTNTSEGIENQISRFDWELFKVNQKRFLQKISNIEKPQNLHDENVQEFQELSLAKLFVYEDWRFEHDEKNMRDEYQLVKETDNQERKSIQVKFDSKENRVLVSTQQEYFKDPEVVTIMLEISRNVQRFANSNKEVKISGLNKALPDHDDMCEQLILFSNALNQGIELNSKDPEKKEFILHFND